MLSETLYIDFIYLLYILTLIRLNIFTLYLLYIYKLYLLSIVFTDFIFSVSSWRKYNFISYKVSSWQNKTCKHPVPVIGAFICFTFNNRQSDEDKRVFITSVARQQTNKLTNIKMFIKEKFLWVGLKKRLWSSNCSVQLSIHLIISHQTPRYR